eukprot:TRINITY_DN13858_c0_g1_i2.p1 TRINITY_DN13858_c0_g1~~TRINITY_DN13858_c0_g1_i2.p1  ORF type:complete len:167 (-),score=35.51 TRINITY_DN13858_c0_g1_i2:1-501(-)
MYYRSARAVLVVFDLSSQSSFDEVLSWLVELKAGKATEVPVLVVGNKCDTQRVISGELAERLAASYGAGYLECSAKTHVGVGVLMQSVALAVVRGKFPPPSWYRVGTSSLRSVCIEHLVARPEVQLIRLPKHVQAEILAQQQPAKPAPSASGLAAVLDWVKGTFRT